MVFCDHGDELSNSMELDQPRRTLLSEINYGNCDCVL
jgi:hypothetical protein